MAKKKFTPRKERKVNTEILNILRGVYMQARAGSALEQGLDLVASLPKFREEGEEVATEAARKVTALLQKAIEKYDVAFTMYAKHQPCCTFWKENEDAFNPSPCSCGLQEVLDAGRAGKYL